MQEKMKERLFFYRPMNMYRFDLVSCAFNDKIPNKAFHTLPYESHHE